MNMSFCFDTTGADRDSFRKGKKYRRGRFFQVLIYGYRGADGVAGYPLLAFMSTARS